MKKILFLSLFLSCGLMLFAQSKMSLNTRHLVSTLKEKKALADPASESMKKFNIRSIGEEKYVNAYILLENDAVIADLEACGVKVNTRVPEVVTASIPVNRLEEVASLEGVKYVQIGTPVNQLMDKAREAGFVNQVHSGIDLPHSFRGTGVVVGVVDNGFQYGHPAFYDMDRNDLRIKRVWEQNTEGTAPEGYNYGHELKTKEEILAAQYDLTDATHGTHVANIAAGGDTTKNAFYGVAPDAEIVLVSMSKENAARENVQVSDGIKYIYDYAKSVNKPCVINLSLGTHMGPHDGTSLFDNVADKLQGEGRLLVGAAGNEGKVDLHVSKTFDSSNMSDSLATFIKVYSNGTNGTIDVWGSKDMKFTIQLHVYHTESNEIISYFDVFDASAILGNEKEYTMTMNKDGLSGNIFVATEVNPINDECHAYIAMGLTGIGQSNFLAMSIKPLTPGTVHAWTEGAYTTFFNNYVPGYTKGTNDCSVGEIGGTGKNIITVGAYVSKKNFLDFSGMTQSTNESLDRLASFSSIGPAADGRMKPDITAPGSTIGSAVSTIYRPSVIANKYSWNGMDYYYAMMDGTSMASPFVAGVLATWLEANPKLRPEDVRSILKNTGIKDKYTGSAIEGNNKWGYGKIDAWNGLKLALVYTDMKGEAVSQDIPGVIVMQSEDSGFKLLFTREYSGVTASVYDLNGKMVHSSNLGNTGAGEELSVNLENTSKGIYIVKVLGNQVSVTSKIAVK